MHITLNGKKMFFSTECIQDMEVYFRSLTSPRASDITDKEIEEYKQAYSQINSMNMEEIYKKVKFEREFIPYQDYE